MVFQVEITPTATAQIEKAYRWYRGYNAEFADRWFRGLMNAIATLQEKPTRCALALEQTIFLPKEVRQLFMGKAKMSIECFLQLEIVRFMCYMFAIAPKHH